MTQSGFLGRQPPIVNNKVVLGLVALVLIGMCLYQYHIDLQFARGGISTEAIVKAKREERHWYQKGSDYYLTVYYATRDGVSLTEDYETNMSYWGAVHPGDKIQIDYLKDHPASIQPMDEHTLQQYEIALLIVIGACAFWMFV